MLLELDDGSLVPLTAVGHIGPEAETRRGPGRAVRDTRGELAGYANAHSVEMARRAALPMLPAPPGWLVVTYADASSDEFWHGVEPVIAWQFDGNDPVPITASGSTGCGSEAEYFVLAPPGSGATDQASDTFGSYRDLEAALEIAEKRWRGARESRAAAEAAQGLGGAGADVLAAQVEGGNAA
jgi:hypothetical protein